MKIHLGCVTQDEIEDLVPNIEYLLPHVDSVTICDSGSNVNTFMYLRNWASIESKIRVFLHPWRDNFPWSRNNYLNHISEIATQGDWILAIDPDEHIIDPQKMKEFIQLAENQRANIIGFRCRSVSLKGKKRVWENNDDYWKRFLIKWDPNFRYTHAGEMPVHESYSGIPMNIWDPGRNPNIDTLWYEHRKQENIIWIRGCRNSFCSGGGDNLGSRNPWWVKTRKLIKDLTGIDDWHSFNKYLIKGNIHDDIKQVMINHMYEGTPKAGHNAISNKPWGPESEMREWYRTYFRIYHPEEEPSEFHGINLDDYNGS